MVLKLLIAVPAISRIIDIALIRWDIATKKVQTYRYKNYSRQWLRAFGNDRFRL